MKRLGAILIILGIAAIRTAVATVWYPNIDVWMTFLLTLPFSAVIAFGIFWFMGWSLKSERRRFDRRSRK